MCLYVIMRMFVALGIEIGKGMQRPVVGFPPLPGHRNQWFSYRLPENKLFVPA